jgi:sugar lactone lactonase YvrE
MAAAAKFGAPYAIALGSDALYVADRENHSIRMVQNGRVSTIAGTGISGFADGPAAQAQFHNPRGVAVSSNGTVYVSDHGNHRIRMIMDGQVSTLAGKGTSGFADGPAAQAQFNCPFGVALGNDGTIYVADSGNKRIRMIRGGQVSTLAGTGTDGFLDGPAAGSQFSSTCGIAVSEDSTVYVTDYGDHRVRMVRNGQVTTLAGNGTRGLCDGPAAQSQFSYPSGVSVTKDGTVYISEASLFVPCHRVRMIRDGQVSTIAGDGSKGFADGPAAQSHFKNPCGVVASNSGIVYVADSSNHRIRVICDGQVSTLAGDGTKGFADGAAYMPLPSLVPRHSAEVSIEKSLKIEGNAPITVNNTSLQLHASFVRLRCPSLLQAPLRVQPVDAESITLFRSFLYSDRIPDQISCEQILGVSVRAAVFLLNFPYRLTLMLCSI